MSVSNPPAGYHSVAPYLLVCEVPGLIDFLKTAFDGKEIARHQRPDGSVGHAEVRIGDSVLMMGTAPSQEVTRVHLYVYVPDVDATYRKALQHVAKSVQEPVLQFYGDRMGGVKDPFGNTWWIGTHVEDVSPEEMARRARG